MAKTSLHSAFKSLRDPRVERRKLHNLQDIIILSILAVLSGAESYDSIEFFGKENNVFLKQFLELKNGIPSQWSNKLHVSDIFPKFAGSTSFNQQNIII